ncbi:ketopantoate reductase family protein [Chachezhania sediminis]|uniref:ketopantoate reductase family protein n=1 Tax=Chachezhania sediminis TaxID=2599291 RepID=UPI00131DB9DF|nr:2-dehydropantoate 2-reductase [Chachezhania sediminis]
MSAPKIAIIGAGAIGTALAARLAAATDDLTFVARGQRAAALRANGVRLEDLEGTFTARPKVTERLTGPVSVLFVCVKCGALKAAIEQNLAGIGPDTRVIPLVNGIPWWFHADPSRPVQAVDPGGELLTLISLRQIVGSVTAMTAGFDEDGETVRSTIPHHLVLGPIVDDGPRPVDLAAALVSSGITLDRADDVYPLVWNKLMLNLATNPVSALTGETLERIAANPTSLARAEALAGEVRDLARSFGVTVDPTGLGARLAKAGDFATSMLQDARAGRPLELAPIVQAPLELAAAQGVPMPETTRLLDDMRRRFDAAA